MSILDKSVPTQLQNGLNKDLTYQREGDVTFALNAIRDSHDGGKFEYQSEPGNELVQGLPSGFTFMGSINGISNEVYLFAASGTNGTIGIFKEGKYTEIVRAAFNWNTQFPITGEFRVRNGCERTIYWCNGDSPDGLFNFDSINDFKTGGVYDVNKFKLVPDILPLKIELVSVNDSGGNIPLGSYYFQAEILDKSLNSISKTDISPQTIIYDDSQNDSYTNIDGGLNIEQYTAEIGGVPLTSKSITLRLSNLNTSFKFIRINVSRQITNTQTIDAHAVGNLIPINSNSMEWTYTGYNVNEGDYPLDYSEMLNNNIKYDTAYVMEQVQGRLLRAGVKQDIRDYSTYQSSASEVKVEWVAKEVLNNSANELGNPKNPNTYWDCTSFQGDEIIAIGQQFLHIDGSWSPVFHNLGRHSVPSDLTLLTVVTNSTPSPSSTQIWESDVEHLGLIVGNTVEKWKVRNTASITTSNTVSHPYDYIGEMGYYETDSNYYDIKDCDNNLIWGEDSLGNLITTSTKIRHHRLPDRRLINLVTGSNGEYVNPIGLKFSNISYPNSDVIGHRFCYVKRNDSNKTVLDSGWFTKQFDNGNLSYTPNPSIIGMPLNAINTSISAPAVPTTVMETGKYGRYNSAEIMFNKKLFRPSHLKFNNCYRFDFIEQASQATFPETGGADIQIDYSVTTFEDVDLNTRENYKINSQIYIEPNSVTLSGFPIDVKSSDFASPDSAIEVNYELENLVPLLGTMLAGKSDQSYVYKKTNNKPYSDLFNLDYKYINFNYVDSTNTNDNIFYNGDTLISMCSTTRVLEQASHLFTGITYSMFEEHHMNSELRHGGIGQANGYYKQNGDYNWLLDKIADIQPNGEYLVRSTSSRWPEYYAYNMNYTKQSSEQSKTSIPITYNYCSDCLGDFENYIIFSPKSFDEESFDLYRINKVNDYVNMPAHRGRITGLKYQNNYLLVHTENSLFILQPNPQALTTDISSVYLTTGDFLSIPPQEIMQTDIGYAGMQSKQHMCEAPQGHAWCDQKRGQIFMFNTKLEELSLTNMSSWFREELPSYLAKTFYSNYGIDYPNTSTLDSVFNGIGIIMYYDPRYKRLIITKKDYVPVDYATTYYDFATNQWKYSLNMNRAVWFSSTTSFENKSWTISYSFVTNNWTSWHSYRPFAAFSDDTHFYTFAATSAEIGILNKNIWKHTSFNNYQNYYNVKYDFIIEWMSNDVSTDSLSTVHYQGYSLRRDAVNNRWEPVDATFDRGIFYNYNQGTGLVNLELLDQHTNPYGNVGFSNLNKQVIKTDDNYKITGLYDIITTNPPMTNAWGFIKLYTGYIDQVPFVANYNYNTSAYNLANIKNKFVLCRLFYKPTQDYKKVINLLQTNEMRSIR